MAFGTLEYFIRLTSEDPITLVPVLVRASIIGSGIGLISAIFETATKQRFRQRSFIYIVGFRAVFYTIAITFWLGVVNGVWNMINEGLGLWEGLIAYFTDVFFLINIISAFSILVVLLGIRQISTLHRRGELRNFVLGKYHQPREIERVFCFVDLKKSTNIAEQLGIFGLDHFSKTITRISQKRYSATKAEIYQYVGDEIILSWPYYIGTKDSNAIALLFSHATDPQRSEIEIHAEVRLLPRVQSRHSWGQGGGNMGRRA